MAKYKQVKILQEYWEKLESKGISANQAISSYLGLPNGVTLGLPKPILAPQARSVVDEAEEEQLKYLTLCVAGIHNFLYKTQTVNGYKNPSSYKINLMAKQIYAELKEESENS